MAGTVKASIPRKSGRLTEPWLQDEVSTRSSCSHRSVAGFTGARNWTAHRAVATTRNFDMLFLSDKIARENGNARRRRAPSLQIFRVRDHFGRRPLRLGRVFDVSPLYFVTFCTHKRSQCLGCDEVHATFVPFAQRAERDFNVAVGRYVIMPEHIHLFVRGGPEFRLGRWIGILKQALTKAANLSRAKRQVWQEGFFDHLLRNDESYVQKWEYVRENPMRAGLVKVAED